MQDIRQSVIFARFMETLGWQNVVISGDFVYLKKFPCLGYFAKMPRPEKLEKSWDIKRFITENRIFKFKIAPNLLTTNPRYPIVKQNLLSQNLTLENFPFNPTVTIRINLEKSEEEIFASFSQSKRRAVRRAIKLGISCRESDNIISFINIRRRQYSPFGFLITKETINLWRVFSPKNASLVMAYDKNEKPLAGILLLFWKQFSYYWFASALKSGKKNFAPSLLVWETLKIAKKKKCEIFDFEGVYDERFPKAAESWKGFTRFKQGFGGKYVTFAENFTS